MTRKSRAAFAAQIAQILADNHAGKIDPAATRKMFQDLMDSAAWYDEATGGGGGTGDVIGPNGAQDGYVAVFDGNGGKSLRAGAGKPLDGSPPETLRALQTMISASEQAAAGDALATILQAKNGEAVLIPPRAGVPDDYVVGKSGWVPPGDVDVSRVIDHLSGLEPGSRLSIGSLDPTQPGYAIMQVDVASLTSGTVFRPKLVAINGTTVLLSAEIDEVDPDLPAKMVLSTHFIAPVWTQSEQNIDFNITASPASAAPVSTYQIEFDGAERVVSIPANQPMPYSLDMTPALYPEIWQWGVASWSARARLRATSADGAGPYSDAYALTISQGASFFIPDADWTFAEERDTAAASGVVGRPKISVSVSRTVPDGVELRYYMGTLPYAEANFATIHNTANSPAISGGGSALAASGNAVGASVYGILLYLEEGSSRWHPASTQKYFITQGLIPVGAPTVAVAPVQSGNGKIGSAQGVTQGTWTGSPTGYAYQALRDGVPITGAASASYTPVATDDGTALSWRITATNGGGQTSFTTTPVPITYPAPTVANTVSSKTYTQESGSYRSVDLSTIFAGAGYDISVSGPSVGGVPVCAVNSTEKTLGISISNIVAATTVRLTATNSGGSISTTFTLTISAGSAVPAPSIIGVGGSNSSGQAVFTNYAADDMIFAMIRRNSGSGFTKPDLASWSGQYDWNEIFYGTSSSQSVGLYYRRCNGNGSDGDLGDWSAGLTSNPAYPTYVTIRGINWASPIGVKTTADPLTWQASAINLDHPGLTPSGTNSLIMDIACHASAIAGQGPGLRPAMTEVVSSVTGIRKMLSRSTVIPASALAAANDVPHTVTTNGSGVQFCAAVEIKGAASTVSLTWPADVAASKVTVTEVTDPAVASAQGFAGESGHIKYVTASDIPVAATTVSGNFELVREIMGGEAPAPSATDNVVTQSQTWYSSGSKSVGGYAYPRFWWRHISSGSMRLALSVTPFEIEGLTGSVPSSFPAMTAMGTTRNEALYYSSGTKYFYPQSGYDNLGANGYLESSGIGIRGFVASCTAYASFAGNTATDAFTLTALRNCLDGANCPSLQGAYAMQHDLHFLTAAYFVKNTPRLWTGTGGLTLTERNKVTSLVKAGMVSGAVVGREGKEAWKNMMGRANSTPIEANPNLRTAQRFAVTIGAAFLGGASQGKAWLDSVKAVADVQAIYDDLVAKGLDNTAQSFNPKRPSGAPTYAQIAAKCPGWTTFGNDLLKAKEIIVTETRHTFVNICEKALPGFPSGKGKVMGTASAPLNALVNANAVGMVKEMNSTDTGNKDSPTTNSPRSSAEYAILSIRNAAQGMLVGLCSGMISRTDADIIECSARMKVGVAHMREITRNSVGWADYANGGTGNSLRWSWDDRVAGSSYLYGIMPYLALADMVSAIVDGTAPVAVPGSYYSAG